MESILTGSHINLLLKKAGGVETMAGFDQDFIIYCLCNSNQVSGELRGKPVSTSRGREEIDYPQAAQKKPGNNGAASHLCACPAPMTVYLYWLLTAFLYHTKMVLLSFKSRNRMHPFLGKPELGSLWALNYRTHPSTHSGPLYSNTPPPRLPHPI